MEAQLSMKYIAYTTARPPSLLGRAALAVSTVALAAVAVMFSAVLLTVILIVGAIAGVWLWWKTREVRRQMRHMQETVQDFQTRNAAAEGEAFQGEVFEGEVIRVDRSDSSMKH
jgi:hypothetical protein